MSIQFQLEIASDPCALLISNVIGINDDGVISKDKLQVAIYAIDKHKSDPIFTSILNYDQVLMLYNQLNSISIIRDAGITHTQTFIELTPDYNELITAIGDVQPEMLKCLLNKVGSNKKIKYVISALEDNDLENLEASVQQRNHKKALDDLKQLLELERISSIVDAIDEHSNLSIFKAGQPEKIFQNWIEKNLWVLGTGYIKQHDVKKISINSIADMILESTDGFIELIELKRPKFDLLAEDKSHHCYYPSLELTKVIGQCLLYLKKLDEYKLNLEQENSFKVLRTRIKIIIGRSDVFNKEQIETLRMLNSNLSHIEIITYDYLVRSGENLVSYYNKK